MYLPAHSQSIQAPSETVACMAAKEKRTTHTPPPLDMLLAPKGSAMTWPTHLNPIGAGSLRGSMGEIVETHSPPVVGVTLALVPGKRVGEWGIHRELVLKIFESHLLTPENTTNASDFTRCCPQTYILHP